MGGVMNPEFLRLLDAGREHYRLGEYEEAEEALRKSLDFTRSFADVHNMLGIIYHHQNRMVDAKTAFEEALRVNPKYTEAALHLTITLNDLGQHERAQEIYAQVAELTRSDSRALDPLARGKIANMHADIASVYASYARHQEALEEFGHALQLCPEFVDLRARMAVVLRDSGKLDEAIDEFNKVKQQRPTYLEARVQLGVTLFSAGRTEEALREWEGVLAADPDNERTKMYITLVSSDAGTVERIDPNTETPKTE